MHNHGLYRGMLIVHDNYSLLELLPYNYHIAAYLSRNNILNPASNPALNSSLILSYFSISAFRYMFPDMSSRLLRHIPLNHLQSRKFLPLLLFQRIGNVLHPLRIKWDRDILQRIRPFLCLADIDSKAVGRIFHYGQLDRQFLHSLKTFLRLIQTFFRRKKNK